MLLVVDIGNTNTVFGVYEDKHLLHTWRKVTDKKITPGKCNDEILEELNLKKIKKRKICGVVISCVVPSLLSVFRKVFKEFFSINPSIVKPKAIKDIRILYNNPQEVGADRIVNVLAGYNKYGGPLIIIDFGTATTFDVVSVRGEYLGGIIVPGIGISAAALFEKAEKLPLVELVKPAKVIGRNTVESIQAGLIFGCVGQVKEIVNRIKKEIKVSPKVIATGGYVELVKEELGGIEIDQYLTLEGLRMIYERNYK